MGIRTFFLWSLVTGLFGLSGVFSGGVDAQSTPATDYHVSVRDGSDRDGDGSLVRPWQTITFALNRISTPAPGHTHRLIVDHGAYDRQTGEQFPIVMRPGIVLEGRGGGTVGLYGSGSGTPDALIEFPASTVFGPETAVRGFFLACSGIGIRVHGASSTTASSPVIEGVNTFQCGVGIEVVASGTIVHPLLRKCVMVENVLDGIRFQAVTSGEIRAKMEDCWFLLNHQTGFSCQAMDRGVIHLEVDDSRVQHNGRRMNPAMGLALLAESQGRITTRFRNVLVADHDVGIYARNHGGEIIDNRFLHVTTTRNAWGLYHDPNGSPAPRSQIDNSIFWGNLTADVVGPVRGDVTFTDFTTAFVHRLGQTPPIAGVDGNLDVDPLFLAAASGDFRLRPGSPVVDQGNLSAGDLPVRDLDRDLRVIDGDGDGLVDPDLGCDERTTLWLAGPARIQAGVALELQVPSNGGFTYIGALSFGTSPGIPLPPPDNRVIPLNPDWLFARTVFGMPPVATQFFGLLDANGTSRLQINIPNNPSIVGLTIYGAALTAVSTNSGVRHISNPVQITIRN